MSDNGQRIDPSTVVLLIASFLLLIVTVTSSPECGCAAARADITAEISVETRLARTFVREAGIRSYRRDDGPAIYAVAAFRADELYHASFEVGLRRVTRGAYARRSLPRPWIVDLWPDAREPALFPRHLSWSRNRVHWQRTYQQALDVMRGDIHHRCALTPHAWGNYYDGERYQRENPTAVELDCGDTCRRNADGSVRLDRDGNRLCNRFFHLPEYARFDEI